MTEQTVAIIFDIIGILLLCMSPIFLLVGISLLMLKQEKYDKLEKTLGKDIGGIRKRIIPQLETDIYIFHQWLLGKRFMIGIFFVIYSALLFIVLSKTVILSFLYY